MDTEQHKRVPENVDALLTAHEMVARIKECIDDSNMGFYDMLRDKVAQNPAEWDLGEEELTLKALQYLYADIGDYLDECGLLP